MASWLVLVVLEVAASVVDVVDCSDVVLEPSLEASVDDVPAAAVVVVELELASSGAETVAALEHPTANAATTAAIRAHRPHVAVFGEPITTPVLPSLP